MQKEKLLIKKELKEAIDVFKKNYEIEIMKVEDDGDNQYVTAEIDNLIESPLPILTRDVVFELVDGEIKAKIDIYVHKYYPVEEGGAFISEFKNGVWSEFSWGMY